MYAEVYFFEAKVTSLIYLFEGLWVDNILCFYLYSNATCTGFAVQSTFFAGASRTLCQD